MDKKEYILARVAIHSLQAAIIKGLKNGKIQLNADTNRPSDSLRDIAEKIGLPKESPQKVKHHIQQLVKLGIIDIKRGNYFYKKL